MDNPGFETICTHLGENPRLYHGAVTPPIFQTSLFTSPDCETFFSRDKLYPDVYDYTRVANPTTDIFEQKVAALEKTEAARAFGSGMGAISAAILSCVSSGDHIVAIDSVYSPTRTLLTNYLPQYGIETTYVFGDDPNVILDACKPNTKLICLESPSSLVFHMQDLAVVAAAARERGILTMIDNSWAASYFQSPIELGVDLVAHTATKYYGGHSDVVAGVVAGRKELIAPLRTNEGALLGAVLDPFAAWLLIRGMRTLAMRLERHQQSAQAVAEYLEAHPRVAWVNYPGLKSHPQYELGRKQMRGNNGLLSFALKDGGQAEAYKFVNSLKWFSIGVSWGGHESLSIPIGLVGEGLGQRTWFPGIGVEPGDMRWGARLHIGLETPGDLMEDLEQALKA